MQFQMNYRTTSVAIVHWLMSKDFEKFPNQFGNFSINLTFVKSRYFKRD